MLSINSIPAAQMKSKSFVGDPLPKPEGALSFKGKTPSKEMKKFYQILENQRINRVLKDPNISKEVKREFMMTQTANKAIQFWNESFAMEMFRKFFK